MKKKHKEYTIHSFKSLMKIVNEENCDMIIGNFYGVVKQWLQMKKKYPDLEFNGFIWIDDGKYEVKKPKLSVKKAKNK